MSKLNQEYKDLVERLIFLIECYSWKRIEHIEEDNLIIARRDGVRINLWYDRMTLGTAMDHPREGSTQMIRKNISMERLEELLDNPRLHTSNGYKLKKGRNWGKTYRHTPHGKKTKHKRRT